MKISVITVCYNSVSTIKDTLRSVAAQDHRQLEYIVVDGKSTDGTLAIVDTYGSLVSKCTSEKDGGIYDAFNKGISLATGEVVGLLNSDDFYPRADVISQVARAFAGDPDLDAIYGDLCYVKQFDTDKILRYWRSSDYKPGLFIRGWVPPHPTFFVRKRVYDRLGGYDLTYRIASDWELLARFIEVNRIRTRYLPQVLVHMRQGGLSNSSWSNVWKQNQEIWRAANAHGLQPSLAGFALGKLWSRGRQFLARVA